MEGMLRTKIIRRVGKRGIRVDELMKISELSRKFKIHGR
jgi:hypothetical protein